MRKYLDRRLEIKSISDAGEFSGYGSVFGVKDLQSDIIINGAFTKSLDRHKENRTLPALLWQHKMDEPIGFFSTVEEDSVGLYVEGSLLIDDDPLAKRAHAHLKAGSLSGMSIGFRVSEDGYEFSEEKDAFILSEIDLHEISLVTFPANEEARVQEVKNILGDGETPSPKTVERCLRDVGFTARQAKAFMSEGYKGINTRDADSEALEMIIKLNEKILY
jgi:HK97 family phage prohead protease